MTFTNAQASTAQPPLLPVRRPPAHEGPDDLVEISVLAGGVGRPFDWSEPRTTYPGFAEARADDPERSAAVEAAERYVRVCLETLNGFRPASHLRSFSGTAPLADVVGQLARRRNNGPMIRGLDRLPPSTPPSRRPMRFAPSPPPGNAGPVGNAAGSTVPGNAGRFAPVSAARTPRPAAPVPPPFRLKRLRHSSPRPGVAEIVAILGHSEVSVACAIRMERHDGKWRPTLIQVI